MGRHSGNRTFTVSEKLEAVRAVESGLTQNEAGAMFGMSGSAVWKWCKKYKKSGIAGLEPHAGRPTKNTFGAKVEAADQLIQEIKREEPEAGISKVQGLLFRRGLLHLARETVRRILRRQGHGPIEGRSLRKNRPPKVRSFERANPNDLWQTDIMTFFIKGQYRVYLIGYMDDHSRLIVGWGLYRFQTQANVMEVFRAAIEKHGMPKEVLSDNGRQYYAWRGKSGFTQMLTKLGIRHIRSRPYHPQTCGKIESFWRNVLQECLMHNPVSSFEEAREKLSEYIEYYNFKRPHQGIGNLAPADRFYLVGEQVRQIVEANTAKVEEQGEAPNYSPPAYIVGNIGGKELRLVAREAEVSLRDVEAKTVESGGGDERDSGGSDGKAVREEAAQPAGADGAGAVGSGTGTEPGSAVQPGGGVEGAAVPVDAPDAGDGAQGAGGQETGAQAAAAGGSGASGEGAQGAVGGAPAGDGPAAQGEGAPGASGADGAGDHPAPGLGGTGEGR